MPQHPVLRAIVYFYIAALAAVVILSALGMLVPEPKLLFGQKEKKL